MEIAHESGAELGTGLSKWTKISRSDTSYYEDDTFNSFEECVEIHGYDYCTYVLGLVSTTERLETEYIYNELGQLTGYTETTTGDADDVTTTINRSETEYDKDGRITSYREIITRDSDAPALNEVSNRSITYDTLGRITGVTKTTYIEGIIVSADVVSNIEYDEDGHVTGYSYTDEGGTWHVSGIEYNEKGKVTGYSKTNTQDKTTETVTTNTYNTQGQLINKTETTYDSKSHEKTIANVKIYNYDTRGRLFGYSEDRVSSDSPDLAPKEVRTYTYYSFGEVTESYSYTHFISYNSFGQIYKETILNHETGQYTDIESLKNMLSDMADRDEVSHFLSDLIIKQGEGREVEPREVNNTRKIFIRLDGFDEEQVPEEYRAMAGMVINQTMLCELDVSKGFRADLAYVTEFLDTCTGQLASLLKLLV
jgi:hypothetical protein